MRTVKTQIGMVEIDGYAITADNDNLRLVISDMPAIDKMGPWFPDPEAEVAQRVAEWLSLGNVQLDGEPIKGGPGSGNFDHAGRPGHVGGSAPRSSHTGSDEDFPQHDSYGGSPITAPPFVWGKDNKLPGEFDPFPDPGNELARTLNDYYHVRLGQVPYGSTVDAGENVRATLIKGTDLSKDDIGEMLYQWGVTTGDHSMKSLLIQQWGGEEFGVEPSSFIAQKKAELLEKIANGTLLPYNADTLSPDMDDEEGAVKKTLRAMYESTQSDLKKAGIDKVVLYRGYVGGEAESMRIGDRFEPDQNPFSSWSLAPVVAENFVKKNSSPDLPGYILKAVVPANRILSTYRTGFGMANEFEFVVMKSAQPDRAVVTDVFHGHHSVMDPVTYPREGRAPSSEEQALIESYVNPNALPGRLSKSTSAGLRTIFLDDDQNADWLRTMDTTREMPAGASPDM